MPFIPLLPLLLFAPRAFAQPTDAASAVSAASTASAAASAASAAAPLLTAAAAASVSSIPGVPAVPGAGFGGPTPPASRAGNPAPPGSGGLVGGGLAFEQLDEDYFATLSIFNNTRIGPVTFGLWVPLRFRVLDNDPQQDGVIRKQDWDEVSDYFRLLRFVDVGLGDDNWRFRGRFGALEGETLGHGTILAGYYNSVDTAHYRAGIALLGALKWGGLEFMLDNVAGPDVFGFRLHARPAVFVTDRPWAHRLVVGFSFADDVHAPADLETVTPPPPAPPAPPAPPQPRSDDGHLWAKSTANVGVFGIDAEYQALTTRIVDVVPYLDVNFQRAAGNTGAGMHLGVFVNLRVPTPVGPSLSMRLEYRVVGSGYLPRYFDSAYQAQRWQYDASNVICAQGEQGCTPGVPLTKLQVLRRGGAGPNGWMGELYADLAGWLAVGGTFEDYQGPNNASLTLSLLFPRLRFIQCGAYYTRRGFDGVSGVFDLDGALLTAWIQARVYGPLYLNASYTRSWHLQPDGTYDSDNNWGVGAGVAFGY